MEEQMIRLTRQVACLRVDIERVVEGQIQIGASLSHLTGLAKSLQTIAEAISGNMTSDVQGPVPDEKELVRIGAWVLDKLGWDQAVAKMKSDNFIKAQDLRSINDAGEKKRILLLANWLLSKQDLEAIRTKMNE